MSPNDQIFLRAAPSRLDWEPLMRSFAGHPIAALRDVPGRIALALLGLAALLALAGHAWRLRAPGRSRDRLRAALAPAARSPWLLVALLVVATPIGLALYGAVGSPIFNARNLSASVPFALLLASAAIVRAPRPLAALAAALAVTCFAIGGIRAVGETNRRAPLREAAAIVNAEAGPRTSVLELAIGSVLGSTPRGSPFSSFATHPLYQDLAIYLDDDIDLHAAYPRGSARAWRTAERVILVAPSNDFLDEGLATAARQAGGHLQRQFLLDGLVPIRVSVYRTAALRTPGE